MTTVPLLLYYYTSDQGHHYPHTTPTSHTRAQSRPRHCHRHRTPSSLPLFSIPMTDDDDDDDTTWKCHKDIITTIVFGLFVSAGLGWAGLGGVRRAACGVWPASASGDQPKPRQVCRQALPCLRWTRVPRRVRRRLVVYTVCTAQYPGGRVEAPPPPLTPLAPGSRSGSGQQSGLTRRHCTVQYTHHSALLLRVRAGRVRGRGRCRLCLACVGHAAGSAGGAGKRRAAWRGRRRVQGTERTKGTGQAGRATAGRE